MALDKAALKAAIKTALLSSKGSGDTVDGLAQGLADAIDAYVKTGTVTFPASGCTAGGIVPASQGQIG